eukprot:TRINITY_DN42_c0_g1_i1.p1 TRINITY_DN42_c0_g1~~TRINITY_DN42_c0_g1_i1.p1  ORF type:complete len:464 (-),score=26.34 TRINITY_DN42_c0_g1_i1:478-1869(-)
MVNVSLQCCQCLQDAVYRIHSPPAFGPHPQAKITLELVGSTAATAAATTAELSTDVKKIDTRALPPPQFQSEQKIIGPTWKPAEPVLLNAATGRKRIYVCTCGVGLCTGCFSDYVGFALGRGHVPLHCPTCPTLIPHSILMRLTMRDSQCPCPAQRSGSLSYNRPLKHTILHEIWDRERETSVVPVAAAVKDPSGGIVACPFPGCAGRAWLPGPEKIRESSAGTSTGAAACAGDAQSGTATDACATGAACLDAPFMCPLDPTHQSCMRCGLLWHSPVTCDAVRRALNPPAPMGLQTQTVEEMTTLALDSAPDRRPSRSAAHEPFAPRGVTSYTVKPVRPLAGSLTCEGCGKAFTSWSSWWAWLTRRHRCFCENCGICVCVTCMDVTTVSGAVLKVCKSCAFVSRMNALADVLSSAAVRMTTWPCPSCAAPIQKNGGCPQMVCAKCKTAFRWCCMKVGHSCSCS